VTDPVRLFLAYRGANEALRDRVLAAIEALRAEPWGRDYPFEIWSDNLLLGVPEWEAEIAVHIDHADLFLLLVTTALDGGYAVEVELQRAITRAQAGAIRIVPVVCEDVIGFLKAHGLDAFRLNRIPKRGVGLAHPPYNGDIHAWLADVTEGVRLSVRRIYEERQMKTPEFGEAARACEAAADRVLDAAEAERGGPDFPSARIAYAAGLVRDLLASATPRVLDLLPSVKAQLRVARQAVRGAGPGAAATLAALESLTASLDDLEGAARLAGLTARSDQPSAPSAAIDTAAAHNRRDLEALDGTLRTVEAVAETLAEEARAAPAARRAGLEDAAARLGADSRLARATIDAPIIDAGELEAVSEQLTETTQAVAAMPLAGLTVAARALLGAAGRAVDRAIRWVARLVARARRRQVPAEPRDAGEEPSRMPDEAFDWEQAWTTPANESASGRDGLDPFTPGAIWRHRVPGLDRAAWPTMVTIPPGRFLMGSPETEEGRTKAEGPRHEVSLSYRLAMGRDPVSVDAFAAFIAQTNHPMGDNARIFNGEKWEDTKGKGWRDPGFPQAGDHPVTCVSWDDARAYVAWLNRCLGLAGRADAYRLPSEAEWEYACRAGTTTPFSFGETLSTEQANYDRNFAYGRGRKTGLWRKGTMPAGAFRPNAFGLRDMHGNVFEWCEDVWHENYDGAPRDGSAWVSGGPSSRVVRGGSWVNDPRDLRSAHRGRDYPTNRDSILGFRLARTLSTPAP
jgi:formylglycine-generating enzyme required for sulfatase activity